MKHTLTAILVFLCVGLLGAQNINQVGFLPSSPKLAYYPENMANKTFKVKDASGKVVFEGQISDAGYWEEAGESVCKADFSSLQAEGKYTIDRENLSFEINKTAYAEVGKTLLKSFYLSRASVEILEEYAGADYARPAGHLDTEVYIHESAASKKRPAESTISSTGGWYDAGDYGKYIVNSGISTYLFLHTYDLYQNELKDLEVNIPESGNGVSDMLDEAVVNLKWMLTMQDPADGGLYHKLNTKAFGPMQMPHEDTKHRYVVLKSTAASLDFAATMSKAFRVLRTVEQYKPLAKECKAAAIKAYKWCEANPDVLYIQPDDIKTGEYKDTDISDEWFWATSEMYLMTKDAKYLENLKWDEPKFTIPEWRNVGTLGLYSIANDATKKHTAIDKKAARKEIMKLAKKHYAIYENSPHDVAIVKFPWGSNGEIANTGVLFLQAYKLTKDEKYKKAADACASYLLGANATGYCFVTSFGTQRVMHIHDRRCESDGNENPIPGLLAGGPTTQAQKDCGVENYPSTKPAKAYIDAECSYSTNEWAINWNSAAMSLFLGLDAVNRK